MNYVPKVESQVSWRTLKIQFSPPKGIPYFFTCPWWRQISWLQATLPSLSTWRSWNDPRSFYLSVSFLMGKMRITVAILTSRDYVGMRGCRRSTFCLTLRTAPLGQSLHPSALFYQLSSPSLSIRMTTAHGTFAVGGVISRMHLLQETRPSRILL